MSIQNGITAYQNDKQTVFNIADLVKERYITEEHLV